MLSSELSSVFKLEELFPGLWREFCLRFSVRDRTYMSGGGPARYPEHGAPSAPPIAPVGGQPVNEAGANSESVVSSYQYSYPGIAYGPQSGTTYNIPGGGPNLMASMSDGGIGYPAASNNSRVPYPIGGVSSVPYPLPGGSNTTYPPVYNSGVGSSPHDGGNQSQYGAPQMGLQGSYSYPAPVQRPSPYPPQRISPFPGSPSQPEPGSADPMLAYTSAYGVSFVPNSDAGRAPPLTPQAPTQSVHQVSAGSQAYPMVGAPPPTYPSIGWQTPQALPQNSVSNPSIYKQSWSVDSYSPEESKVTKKALVIGCNYQRTSAELKVIFITLLALSHKNYCFHHNEFQF